MDITYTGTNDKAYSLNTTEVSDATLRYLVEYGLKQSLADSIAGVDAAIKAAHADKTKWEVFAKKHGFAKGLDLEAARPYVEEHRQSERFKAIMDGTMAVRSGGARLDPVEREIRTIAAAKFKEVARANGITKLPVGEEFIEMLAAFIDKNRAAFEAQANANLAARAALDVTIDLSSLKVA